MRKLNPTDPNVRTQVRHTTPADQMTKCQYDFDVRDQKGRMIGVQVTLYEQTFTELTPEEVAKPWSSWYHVRPGTYLCAYAMATRDGRPYGASQNEARFTDPAQRNRWVIQRVADARKRYVRQFGKPQDPGQDPGRG